MNDLVLNWAAPRQGPEPPSIHARPPEWENNRPHYWWRERPKDWRPALGQIVYYTGCLLLREDGQLMWIGMSANLYVLAIHEDLALLHRPPKSVPAQEHFSNDPLAPYTGWGPIVHLEPAPFRGGRDFGTFLMRPLVPELRERFPFLPQTLTFEQFARAYPLPKPEEKKKPRTRKKQPA